MKLSGTKMSYTWPVVGIHKAVRYWNVIYIQVHKAVRYLNVLYMTCSRYGWNNTGNLVALWPPHRNEKFTWVESSSGPFQQLLLDHNLSITIIISTFSQPFSQLHIIQRRNQKEWDRCRWVGSPTAWRTHGCSIGWANPLLFTNALTISYFHHAGASFLAPYAFWVCCPCKAVATCQVLTRPNGNFPSLMACLVLPISTIARWMLMQSPHSHSACVVRWHATSYLLAENSVYYKAVDE